MLTATNTNVTATTGPAPVVAAPHPRRADESARTTERRPQPPMTAAEVAALVGHLDIDTARTHHVEMTAVVAELSRSADRDWPWTHDDPTVSLLRAIARLALTAPDAVSECANGLALRVAGTARSASRRAEISA